MSADFGIKPVGSPVAAPFVSPGSEAASRAVPTQLPAPKSVGAIDRAARGRLDTPGERSLTPQQNGTPLPQPEPPLPGDHLSHQVIVDQDAAAIVYQVVDNRTSTVVEQFPDDAMLRRRAYFHAIDLGKDAPTPVQPTDRKA
jgi:hypothetical protein